MKKKQIDSKLALLEIETLVSNYTETEVDIFIGILCVRFMREYNIGTTSRKRTHKIDKF